MTVEKTGEYQEGFSFVFNILLIYIDYLTKYAISYVISIYT